MSLVSIECWKCDRCGHVWVAADRSDPPPQCPACHRKNWNRKYSPELQAEWRGRKVKASPISNPQTK